MNRAAKEFEHSVVNFVSSNSLAGVCDNNHSPKCKSFTCLYKSLLFIDVTSAVHANAWLSLLDGKQPTVFDNDVDMGAKPTEDVLFHLFKYFFHLMIVCEHCNDQCLKKCRFPRKLVEISRWPQVEDDRAFMIWQRNLFS